MAGWGVAIRTLYPSGIEQPIVLGTPAVSKLQKIISPTGIEQLIALGTPTLTKRTAISPDYPDWTESMQLTGTEIYLPVNIQGASVTLPVNVTAVTIGIISVDIVAQTIGNIAVNIAASAVTINMDIKAQSVAIKIQAEWSVQAGQHKFFRNTGSNVATGIGCEWTYTVPTGKTFYITHFGGSIYGTAAADRDKDQICYMRVKNDTTTTTLAEVGGHGGGGMVLPTPIKIPAGQTVSYGLWNFSNHNCEIFFTLGGYEL